MSEERQLTLGEETPAQETAQQLIQVVQLPVITQRLRELVPQIDQQVAAAKSLACTEETVSAVKKARAAMNAQFEGLEERRKAVKQAIMAPYNEFEKVYKECVTDKFRSADADLKAKISGTESGVKKRKADDLRIYFNEAAQAQHVEFLSLEDAGLNVTLSASLTSLKKNAKAFIDRIEADVAMIETQEHSAEIMVEFKQNGFRASAAITDVLSRHKEMQRQQELAAKRAEQRQREAEAAKKLREDAPEAFRAPVAAPAAGATESEVSADMPHKAPDDILTVAFRVRDTRERLLILRNWMDANGYEYK